MTDLPRTMLAFDVGQNRFQVRAAAIIRRDGHILIHRATSDPFWGLPGGRVEFREPSAVTLVREIEEEMRCAAEAGPLCYLVENFFTLDGRRAHELGFYFEAVLVGEFPFSATEVCHRSIDGGTTLEFRWVRPDAATLRRFDLKPSILIPLLERPVAAMMHLVQDEA